MRTIDVDQNSPEWLAARIGKITASNMHKIISPAGQESKQVSKYVSQLIAEIIRGEPCNSFKGNENTERGHELEQEAADYYQFVKDVELKKVGFCLTDDGVIGASPDRFVCDDGILEIKTCLPEIMVEQYEKTTLEQDHRPQTQAQLFVTERNWVDTMLYCPKMTPIIVHSERNTSFIMDMVSFTKKAHASMQSRLQGIIGKGYYEPAKSQ